MNPVKLQDTKINIQKSFAFLYTNNELSKKKEKKLTNPFTIASSWINYLGRNLTKEVEDLYTENHKTLMKEIEDNTNKWKIIPCSQIGRINITKLFTLPKVIYRFNVIPIKIPMAFFHRNRKNNLKICMEP